MKSQNVKNVFIGCLFVLLSALAFSQDNKVYTTPEKQPFYSGGNVAIAKFLKENVKYPEAAKADSTSGTVIVSFIVEISGGLSSIEVVSGIGKGCDEEALRVVRKMTKWFPGSVGGKPVRTFHKISIKFPQ
jgi:periplasmic protein TonB